MARKPSPKNIDDELLVLLYREILYPWEVNYQNCKFSMPRKQEGFKKFCTDNNIVIDGPTSSSKIQEMQGSFIKETRKVNGLFRFSHGWRGTGKNRESYTIPKCLLYHMRNSIAHASFGKKKYQGIDYLYFEGWFRGKLKLQAQIQVSLINKFMDSLVSTKVDSS